MERPQVGVFGCLRNARDRPDQAEKQAHALELRNKHNKDICLRLECSDAACLVQASHPLVFNDGQTDVQLSHIHAGLEKIKFMSACTSAILHLEFPDPGKIVSLHSEVHLFRDIAFSAHWYATRGFSPPRGTVAGVQVFKNGWYDVDVDIRFLSFPRGLSLVIYVDNEPVHRTQRAERCACLLLLKARAILQLRLVGSEVPVTCPVSAICRLTYQPCMNNVVSAHFQEWGTQPTTTAASQDDDGSVSTASDTNTDTLSLLLDGAEFFS
jgi:hypothetical protein